MKKRILLLIALMLLMAVTLMAFAACANNDSYSQGGSNGGDAPNNETGDGVLDYIQEGNMPEGRKITYNVKVSIKQEDVVGSNPFIIKSLKSDEWFENVEYSESNARYVARVKTSRVNAYINELSSHFGKGSISGFNMRAEDISQQYYTLETHIAMLEEEKDRLNELKDIELDKSEPNYNTIVPINERLIKIENELNNLNVETKRYDDLVEYSTVVINISKPAPPSRAWIAAIIVPVVIIGIIVLIVWLVKRTDKLNAQRVAMQQNNYRPMQQPPYVNGQNNMQAGQQPNNVQTEQQEKDKW